MGRPLEYERTLVPALSLGASVLAHAALLFAGGLVGAVFISNQAKAPVLRAAKAEMSIAISGPSPQPSVPTEPVKRPPPPERSQDIPREEAPGPALSPAEPVERTLDRSPAREPEHKVELARAEFEPPRGGVIAAEALLGPERPRYPERARRHGIEGTGVYEIDVNERGRVDGVRVISSAGHAELDESVTLFFLMRARYNPATMDGVPIPFTVRQEVSFMLKSR